MRVKRHFMRWRVDQKVEVKFTGVSRFVNAVIRDISLMGMQISLDEELPGERSFPLTVRLAGGVQWNVEPWVAWHSLDERTHVYGIYFNRIHDADKEKIWGFINTACQDQICSARWQAPADEDGQECAEDRRVFQRFALHCPMMFGENMIAERQSAEVVDFSARGVGMVSSMPLPLKKPLQMWLRFPCQEGDLLTRGSVAWTRELGDGNYRSGIELDKADLMGITGLIR